MPIGARGATSAISLGQSGYRRAILVYGLMGPPKPVTRTSTLPCLVLNRFRERRREGSNRCIDLLRRSACPVCV